MNIYLQCNVGKDNRISMKTSSTRTKVPNNAKLVKFGSYLQCGSTLATYVLANLNVLSTTNLIKRRKGYHTVDHVRLCGPGVFFEFAFCKVGSGQFYTYMSAN